MLLFEPYVDLLLVSVSYCSRWQGTARGWKILHHRSPETSRVAHFVNYRLHSTLYSTLLIYSVKAYFKKKPHCVYLSKFLGILPILALFTSKRNEGPFLMTQSDGRNEVGNRVFHFLLPWRRRLCFKALWLFVCEGFIWNFHVLFYFLTKFCVPMSIFWIDTHTLSILFCVGEIYV